MRSHTSLHRAAATQRNHFGFRVATADDAVAAAAAAAKDDVN